MLSKTREKLLETKIGPHSVREWDLKWDTLPGGFPVRHVALEDEIGLYRANLEGKPMVIGMASEKKAGLYKRLYDFIRPSDSARKHRSGRFIHDHQHELELQVLVVGNDSAALNSLLDAMIELHQPCENATEEEIEAEIDRKRNLK